MRFFCSFLRQDKQHPLTAIYFDRSNLSHREYSCEDLASKIKLSLPVASAAVHSKAVVLLLLMHCSLLLPVLWGFMCLVLVLLCST